jgi:FAD/FMN-containing dehydrogenase
VSPTSTAFGLRRQHFMLEAVAAWEPSAGDTGDEHRQWAHRLSQTLASEALPGGYANLLGPDDRDQIAFAHGPNIARLRDAKRRFDPDNMFSAIPLAI